MSNQENASRHAESTFWNPQTGFLHPFEREVDLAAARMLFDGGFLLADERRVASTIGPRSIILKEAKTPGAVNAFCHRLCPIALV
ncbi:MAG: hypothetical protein JXA97_13190 [Anaerolineales bacterium]|nr:hypothetical protein [Anaerolineales bacterium]